MEDPLERETEGDRAVAAKQQFADEPANEELDGDEQHEGASRPCPGELLVHG